jgi:predicted transcriptional regulator
MNTRVVTAHLPGELAERLDALAEDLERPRGWLVKEAIQSYLDLEDERRRETIAALKEVDAGSLVEHSEVEAWVRGLRSASKPRARVRRAG